MILISVLCLAIGALLIAVAFMSMEYSSISTQSDIGNIASILHANDIDFEDVFVMQNQGDSVALFNDKAESFLPEFLPYYSDTLDDTALAPVPMER